MIKVHHYSRDKFLGFTLEKQYKSVLEMLSALEQNIFDPDMRIALMQHLQECLVWLPSTGLKTAVATDLLTLRQLDASMSPHQIISFINPILNTHQQSRADSDYDISHYDGTSNPLYKRYQSNLPVYAVLDNLRSAYNVGAIFRNAECFGIKKLYLCGITPTPANPKVIKTAMGTEAYVPWQYYPTTQEAIAFLRQNSIELIALETSADAIILQDYTPTQPLALILGNEALGIDPEIIKHVDNILTIPIFGFKNSFNVSTAFAIAAYSITMAKG